MLWRYWSHWTGIKIEGIENICFMSDDNTNEVIFYNIGFHLVALSPVGHLVFIVKEMSTGRVKYPAQQVVSNLGLVD